MTAPHLTILGVRGIPAQHGGFETFAEYLSLHLVEQGWEVTVYCQIDGTGKTSESVWRGVKRVHVSSHFTGPLGTMIFDLKSTIHSLRQSGIFLVLGYNTAIFNILHRLKSRPLLMNMDGIEWRRQKWGRLERAWLWFNEQLGCRIANHLIADHPEIAKHLATRISSDKITMIPYGGREVNVADERLLKRYDISRRQFAILVARPEPENSVLEIVTAFSSKMRGIKLVILGRYTPENNEYHRRVMSVASGEVIFVGPVYESAALDSLRYHALFYLHGHQIGGTNPSLTEALAAGNPIIAHDNRFNRWVADNAALYFHDIASAQEAMETLINDLDCEEDLRRNAKRLFNTRFRWETVLGDYEILMNQWK